MIKNSNSRALSVRQPYAELILQGKKTVENRSRNTKIRGRVFIYAALKPGDWENWKIIDMQPGDLPTGVLVGTVEITDCTGEPGNYYWHLSKPERLKQNLKPENKPQPIWFYPF